MLEEIARRHPKNRLPPLLAATGSFAALLERICAPGRHAGLTSVPHGAKTYLAAALALAGVAYAPTLFSALGFFIVAMLALGVGNGSVFQLVPQRFAQEIGVMTGLVGMAGDIGGFYLASSLGIAKQFTGSFAPGFLIFAGLALVAFLGISLVRARWRATWTSAARI